MKQLLFTTFIVLNIFCAKAQNIEDLYKNSKTNTDFSSYFTVKSNQILTDIQVNKWVAKNKHLFSDFVSVKINSNTKWVYGSQKNVVTRVDFLKTENVEKRNFFYAEIAREKEEARVAELKKQDEIRKQKLEQDRLESLRLAKIKSEIENGTFTGEHFYDYPEGQYVGRFVKGIREGMGKQYLSNGEWYEGQFKNGKANGRGTFRQSGGIRYTGNFVNWKRQVLFLRKNQHC